MMKRLFAFFLAVVLLLTFCACGKEVDPEDTEPTIEIIYPTEPTAPDFSKVDESKPNAEGVYEIHSAEGLKNLAAHPDGKFLLLWNIDLEGAAWTPVGTEDAPFTGEINGAGYTISNFTVAASEGYNGFVGVNKGTVKELKLANVTVTADKGTTGGLVGLNMGTMENCGVTGTMTVSGNAVAGTIVGKATGGAITGCEGGLRVEAASSATVGLLAGVAENVTLTKCYFTGPMNLLDGKLFTTLLGKQTKASLKDCLVRDNTRSTEFASEEEQKMRENVEQEMRLMGSVQWTTDELLNYYHTSGSSLHTQIYVPGIVYEGLPYTGKDGGYDRFAYCFEEFGKMKDFAKANPIGADNFDMYMGNDCSGAVYWAWSKVSETTDWRWTQDMLHAMKQGSIGLGEYEGKETLVDTMDIYEANKEQTMAEAFALMRKGDACTTSYDDDVAGSEGHCRLMAQDPVILRDAKGKIDIDASYLHTHEQGDGLYNYKNSTWIVDGTYTLRTMMEHYYIPLTCKELLEGKQPECTVTIDNDGEGKAYMTTGVIKTNYRLASATIEIKDQKGNLVWEKTLFTAVDKFANSNTDYATRTTIREFDVAEFGAYITEAELKKGETYTYELSAMPGNREKYVLKTFEFVN